MPGKICVELPNGSNVWVETPAEAVQVSRAYELMVINQPTLVGVTDSVERREGAPVRASIHNWSPAPATVYTEVNNLHYAYESHPFNGKKASFTVVRQVV